MKRLLIAFACTVAFMGNSCANTPASQPLDEPQDQTSVSSPDLKPLPANVAPADVFKTIVAGYEGSVVFIDFWATWCPPCRQAMKMVDAVKPDLKAKGCKFVYVTGETSPRGDFDAMYKSIDGDHFYLTNAQFQGLLSQFQVEGVPHYILVDKTGKVVWQHTGYPGNDEVKSQVEVALSK